MKLKTRPWLITLSLTGALVLLFSFQNCAPMLPLEGVATINSNARPTATPGPLATPNPGTGGYTQNVIDGMCSDNVSTDPMAATYVTAANGTLLGFKNTTTKQTAIWKVSGGNVIHGVVCSFQGPAPADSAWELAGIGDFNGDYQQDILWRNSMNGKVAVWIMNGANRTQAAILTRTVSGVTSDLTMTSDWNVEGVGLFSGTGRYSVVWRNNANEIQIWDMNGVSTPTTKNLQISGTTATAPAGYSIAGLGDFNANYRSDILFRSGDSHVVWFTATDGVAVDATTFVDAIPGSSSTKVIGDFNGDGKADLLLVNSDRSMTVRYMSYRAQVTTALQIAAPSENWTPLFAQDVTSDNVADWIWTIPGPSERYVSFIPMAGAPGLMRTLNPLRSGGWEVFEYAHK